MAPQQPSWKQEARQETTGAESAPTETKPAEDQKPEGSGEKQ
jgi:hypothetical protein